MLAKHILAALSVLALAVNIPLAAAQDEGKDFVSKCAKPGVVSLTFDDGPSAYTDELLAILAAKNVKATYFVIGENVATYSAGLLKEYNAGHQIALHTYQHPNLSTLTAAQLTTEIGKSRDVVKKVIGATPIYMRPPYGECDAVCATAMSKLGYIVSMWNLDSNDWQFKTNVGGAHGLVDNVLKGINASDPTKDSFIILMHNILDFSIKLVPEIIDGIRAKGYTFDTVAGCANGRAPYVEGWGPVNGNSSVVPSSASLVPTANATLSSAIISPTSGNLPITSGSGSPTSSSTKPPTTSGANAVRWSAGLLGIVGAVVALSL